MKSNLSQLRQKFPNGINKKKKRQQQYQQWPTSNNNERRQKIQLQHTGHRISHAIALLVLLGAIEPEAISCWYYLFHAHTQPNTTKSIWPVKIELALDSRIYVLDIKQCQFNYSGGFCHLYQLSHSTHYITASTTFTPPHPLPQRYYIITRIQIQWIICYQLLLARSFARSHSHILPLRIALHALVGYCFFAFVLIFIYFRISEMFPLPKKALQVFF